MRIFKTKWLQRWARKEGVPDAALLDAAREVVEGIVDADLGGGLFKKRLGRAGAGKSGGYRLLLGYKKPNVERIVFIFAFAKSERATITKKEEAPLRMTAEFFFSASDEKIYELLEIGEATEVIENE